LSDEDRLYIEFLEKFENRFLAQGSYGMRTHVVEEHADTQM
jgi:vacuolar-type H+-ATPase subunit B/Vma2